MTILKAVRGDGLRAGDTLVAPVAGAIEDYRAPSREWPISVGVKIGGAWQPLPAEALFTVERP